MQIKAGFRLEVETWENDADNYRTKVLDGLTEAEVKFYVELAKAHYSMNGLRKKGFGNMYEPGFNEKEEYADAMRAIFRKHISVLNKIWDDFEPSWIDEESFLDMVRSVNYELGIGGSEYYFTRVTDSIKVSYTPVDIYLEDRTAEFV